LGKRRESYLPEEVITDRYHALALAECVAEIFPLLEPRNNAQGLL
jgi:hypothetical protein